MNWLFYLDDTEIEEPVGFRDIEISMKRDDTYHGMAYEASTSSLQFYGVAYTYLKDQYNSYGVKANVKFRALGTCDNYDYEEILSGRLNFGKFKEQCGGVCTCTLPVEEDSCQVILNARRDQKVDLDKSTAIDGFTPLDPYPGLAVETELPAHNMLAQVEGFVADGGDVVDLSIFSGNTNNFVVRPTYGRPLYESVYRSQLLPSVFAASDNGVNDSIISPVLLLDDGIACFNDDFDYETRLKGSYNYSYAGAGTITDLDLVIAYGEYPVSLTELHRQALAFSAPRTAAGTFDFTYSGVVPLLQGKGFYVYIEQDGLGMISAPVGTVTFDQETYINISATKSCPASNAELYFIHETLSRITESITNYCVRVKSSYYGRTDSEPFAFPEDGCGGLRTVTSGLKIRNAIEDKYFDSLKNLIEGLNAIDNIGLDVIDDPDFAGSSLMRVEAVDFFYQDNEVLRHDGVPKAEMSVEENKHYSRIDVGYKKWEVEGVNGLDEFNSNRQYNTSIDTINSPLDITSTLIAGSYPIELTRQQSFAVSGGADSKYDNDTFIICMERPDYPYGTIIVEQGNMTNPQNIFSPSTIYNYRLSPLRNLMRWYKSIAAAFASLGDAANQLFFAAGTGNLIASGIMTDTTCRLENVEIQENQNIFTPQFTNSSDYTPLWKNELLSYEYPMSVADYRLIKAQPYGYISTQCGNGDFEKHWIKEIKWKPAKGTATFTLKPKYGI